MIRKSLVLILLAGLSACGGSMSGTAISALPAAGSVGVTDLFAKVTLGSPNVTQRASFTQIIAGLAGQTIPGQFSATQGNGGNEVVNFSQFNPTISSPGNTMLPGGVTMQWGSATTNGSGLAAVTFPVAFSNTPWNVQVSTYNNGSPIIASIAGIPASTGALLATGKLDGTAFPAGIVFWFAIGPT